tara:strand:+ start:56892 stop:57653 length:762 start_codon:yes stop_codon:yes gene_type:complete
MRVQGKVALVTGGGSGLGEAMSIRLAEEGATVVVSDINESAAQRVAGAIGGDAIALHQDVTDEKRWTEILADIVERFGKLDVLVNNAGIALVGTVEDTTLADWRLTTSINLDAVFVGTREAIKVMKSGSGSIINISSIEGIIGEQKVAAYNASKAGVRNFTKSAALHCCAENYSIRVNSVHPGFIDTAMVSGAVETMSEVDGEAFTSRIVGNIPMGHMGEPLDIANGVLFLASDESKYMTGSELVIDGGYIAR